MKRLMSLVLLISMLTACSDGIVFDEVVHAEGIEENLEGEIVALSGATVQEEEHDVRPPRPEDGEEGKRPPRPEDGEEGNRPPRPEGDEDGDKHPKSKDGEKEIMGNEGNSKYSLEQAMSDNAQLTTIAFSGLAYLTGTEGADAFFPPGKVADFFGFQYMRDVDVNGYGHNTTFLTKVASNILYILNEEQIEWLKELAGEQDTLFEEFGMGRLDLIHAFRTGYEDDSVTLDVDAIETYTGKLYEIDAELSYERAKVFGQIARSLTGDQLEYISQMAFDDSSTWPEVSEDDVLDKKSMSHMEHVAVMTYASEFFSWYAGTVEADVYFCPERHGTYFGGFYMKDYPAMNNPDYFISTTITGNSGRTFLEILDDDQRRMIEDIIDEQRDEMERIADIRRQVVLALRGFMETDQVDKSQVVELIREYGELDGRISTLYAERFAAVGRSLTEDQYDALYELRNQYVFPEGSYLFSREINMPTDFDDGFLME